MCDGWKSPLSSCFCRLWGSKKWASCTSISTYHYQTHWPACMSQLVIQKHPAPSWFQAATELASNWELLPGIGSFLAAVHKTNKKKINSAKYFYSAMSFPSNSFLFIFKARHPYQFAVWIQLCFGNTGNAGPACVWLVPRCLVRLDWFLCCWGSSQGFERVGHQTNPSGGVCVCVFGVVVSCMLLLHS